MSKNSEYHKSGLRACELFYEITKKVVDENKSIGKRIEQIDDCLKNNDNKSVCVTMDELSDLSLRSMNLIELYDERKMHKKKCKIYIGE